MGSNSRPHRISELMLRHNIITLIQGSAAASCSNLRCIWCGRGTKWSQKFSKLRLVPVSLIACHYPLSFYEVLFIILYHKWVRKYIIYRKLSILPIGSSNIKNLSNLSLSFYWCLLLNKLPLEVSMNAIDSAPQQIDMYWIGNTATGRRQGIPSRFGL